MPRGLRWYLAELLLGLPDPDHFGGISDKGRRFPFGHVVRVTVLVLLGRTRVNSNYCQDFKKQKQNTRAEVSPTWLNCSSIF